MIIKLKYYLNRVRERFALFYSYFIKPPKVWKSRHKKDVLIYDEVGKELLQPFFGDYSSFVLHTRGEAIIMPCFFLSLLDKSFWIGKPLLAYQIAVIKKVNPKLVITYIHNNKRFYVLKNYLKGVKTIFIQNGWPYGWTSEVFATLEKNNKYEVDHMLVFNQEIAKKFRQYISGETIVLGSLKNNKYLKAKNERNDEKNILFISSFREKKSQDFYTKLNGDSISWDQFYCFDKLILEYLGEWCFKTKKNLVICGVREECRNKEERDWYQSILENHQISWDLFPRESMYSSYKHVDDAEITVSVGSCLGYEAFSRGNRSAFFTGRGKCISEKGLEFAWPLDICDRGPFWTNQPSKSEVFKIMDFLNEVDEKEWLTINKKYKDRLVVSDPGNTKLKNLILKLMSNPSKINNNLDKLKKEIRV